MGEILKASDGKSWIEKGLFLHDQVRELVVFDIAPDQIKLFLFLTVRGILQFRITQTV
jgi:hypothetical protein